MAVALDQFVKQLEDSGILAGDTLKDFIPPKASPNDAEELARELVRKKKLTKFQAEEVYKGKAKSLVLGNYVLMEKIGAGGMGQVFKARHRRMDRIVAVKLLPAAMTKDPAVIARFGREVKAAAKISHPNIVAAFDADCANGVHFLVMECVDGSDLSVLVKKHGPVSIENSVNYILQAAKGLEAAHKKGIVHRDIKPANLLLDTEGTVKILDMGLARLSADGDAPTQAELTSTGAVMGTVDYMAPEQALDTKTADARADIYALGCSLYYLLTGKATYDGDSIMAKLLAHREQSIPSLRAARPEVPEQVEDIFRKMVAKTVQDRYQTMTEVITDLERCSWGNEETVVLERTVGPASDSGLTNFLAHVSVTAKPTAVRKKPAPAIGGKNTKNFLMLGGGILGVLILLAGLVVTLKTKDGTLVVTVNESDAQVQVLSEEGKIEITRKGEKGPISISVDPGKYRLKVTKDGFTVFGQDFEIESGGKMPITAKLIPLAEKPPVLATKPAPVAGLKPPADSGVKKPLAFTTPGFDQWVKEVAAQPAEKQVEAVSKKLVELNPGFDGKLTHTIENAVVIHLQFLTDNVTDISPVRALVGLLQLSCYGSSYNGRLADLSPLKGMPLTNLLINGTEVADLSPLTGMKLMNLHCGATKVADLSPLRDMPLDGLYVNQTQVSNLSLLKDMPLTHVYCDFKPFRDTEILRSIKTLETINEKPAAEFWKAVETQQMAFQQWMKQVAAMPAEQQVEAVTKKLVELNPGFDGKVTPTIENGVVTRLSFLTDNVTDISPVRALAGLQVLHCGGSDERKGRLANLSPLKGMSLIQLNCVQTSVSDLSPLTGMPLTVLYCGYTRVSDLSPLTDMKLTNLGCSETPVSNLSPLIGMPLTFLDCGHTMVSDLLPLKDMKLSTLTCQYTPVSNLSPLSNVPLTTLICGGTQVSNLSPLKGMPLTKLDCRNTPVSDLSPIKDMPLKELVCDFKPFRDTELLRSIKTLESINSKPAAEFWEAVESQQMAFQEWMKQVAAMPAEQQVEAVSKKLVEWNPGFDGKLLNRELTAPPKIEKGVVTEIGFLADNVTDISPVGALTGLTTLRCSGSELGKGIVSDLAPIAGLPLLFLDCFKTNVSDLRPLASRRLLSLNCYGTKVSDLSPLKAMKLRYLNCDYTPVADLSPLEGMPLGGLTIAHTHVSDLSPIKDMPIRLLVLDFKPERDTELLRSIKGLEEINGKPTSEFWKEVEEQQKGKKSSQ